MSNLKVIKDLAEEATTSQSSLYSLRPSSPSSVISSAAASVVTAPETQEQGMDLERPVSRHSRGASPAPAALKIPVNNGSRSFSRSPSRPRTATDASKPYPSFLLQSPNDVKERFTDLEWMQRKLMVEHSKDHDNTNTYGDMAQTVTSRNRYANVEVYHNNRIALQVPQDACDYINASPIILERHKSDEVPSRYIATQGPKDTTLGHFWHMIWEQSTDTAIIIMLTKVNELGREKCYNYLPRPEPIPINIEDTLEDIPPDYTILPGTNSFSKKTGCYHRDFKIRKEQTRETRRIIHYAFESWPDFSVPEGEHRKQLTNLVNEIRELVIKHPDSPRVVHCSAGVGRSGTFIALDFLFRLLKEGALKRSKVGERDVIHDVVRRLRQQRMMMVQGEAQYALIYDILREEMERMWNDGELPRES